MSTPPAAILIVDDEELNRDGLARRLQRHEYEVTCATSGREAIELLGGRRFDLVLLDIMMPGMNGLEVLKFLRRVDSLIDLPIIMVTAKGRARTSSRPSNWGLTTTSPSRSTSPSCWPGSGPSSPSAEPSAG